MNWQNKTTVKKGNIGERIVDNYLLSKGYVPYKPEANIAHPFDRLCATRDKKTIFIAEVKSKSKRKYYPDTGIDIRHYNDYKLINKKYSIDVFLFFVDEENKSIYGGLLKSLIQPIAVNHKNKTLAYPLIQKGIIYFPLLSMKKISGLSEKEINRLSFYTTKNKKYQEVLK